MSVTGKMTWSLHQCEETQSWRAAEWGKDLMEFYIIYMCQVSHKWITIYDWKDTICFH